MNSRPLIFLLYLLSLSCQSPQDTLQTNNQPKSILQASMLVDEFLASLVYTKGINYNVQIDTTITIDTIICNQDFCHITKKFKIFDTDFIRHDKYYGLPHPRSVMLFIDSSDCFIEAPQFNHKLANLNPYEFFKIKTENAFEYKNQKVFYGLGRRMIGACTGSLCRSLYYHIFIIQADKVDSYSFGNIDILIPQSYHSPIKFGDLNQDGNIDFLEISHAENSKYNPGNIIIEDLIYQINVKTCIDGKWQRLKDREG